MNIDIIIPTYEYKGLCREMLEQCLQSVDMQTYKNYKVIIVDHSKDDVIEKYIKKWHIPILYHRNECGRGNSSINMNEGIKLSNADYIKILHMDDWFCNPNALLLMRDAIQKEPEKKWGGFGFNHFYEAEKQIRRYIKPHINSDIRTLLGCPSVSFFVNDKKDPIYYDENLIIINDSDMHIRLGKKYGYPILIDDICVTIRMHENQVSNNVSSQKHLEEIAYYKKKNF